MRTNFHFRGSSESLGGGGFSSSYTGGGGGEGSWIASAKWKLFRRVGSNGGWVGF